MPLLEVGHIAKPHGLKGEVIVDLSTDRVERLAPGATLHTDGGILTVERSQPHQQRWIVDFREINDRAAAEALRGVVLRAEPIDDPDTLWIHELIGAEVRDVTGRALGRASSVEANPASDLLVLDDGGLIPLHFVVEHSRGLLIVDIPEGLIE